jgi:two-component system, chemotaxis family, CheB/CheR fusion protein
MLDPAEPRTFKDAQQAYGGYPERGRLLVVGIGASAGGLEAFERFLGQTRPDSGLAYVFVQHLDPEHESLLVEILARSTSMPVEFAKDGQQIEGDHVFVGPPGARLLIEGGRLHLGPLTPKGNAITIDAFLTSLANDQHENAVGIVLSGTGSDGALGIRAIRDRGGMTFAQAPQDARSDGMPQAAIATGSVSRVLPAPAIPAALAELLDERRQHPPGSTREEAEGLREAFERLATTTGRDFSRYKRNTILRRLRRRMVATSKATLRDYTALLDSDPDEIQRLADDLMINVTSFFRDGEPFDILERVAIPEILGRRPTDGARAWVAGCSSGEEAYSLAMLFREQVRPMAQPPSIQIFATDIDEAALAEARRGRYTPIVERQVTPARLAQFFIQRGDSYTVTKEIRDLCIFTAHDLLKDPPFSRIDLMSCRNLLIYLEPVLQKRVLELAHYALRPGGFLVLGKAETTESHNPDLFEAVDATERVFRRREGRRRPSIHFFPGSAGRAMPLETPPLVRPRGHAVRAAADRSRDIVLEDYAPASVVVDRGGEIRYYWGSDLALYLPLQAGPPATNLVQLVRPELRLALEAALLESARQGKLVTDEQLVMAVEGTERRLNLIVRPLSAGEQGPDELFLVIFQKLENPLPAGGDPLDMPTLARYRRLEIDLEKARARLGSTTEELENTNEALRDSNEQLHSLNEELHSSNEELQTSQEELQSVNEELNTVNAELNKKVEELELLYGDLHNFFRSTEIATLFVDRELRIARFTPSTTSVFRLVESDIGRHLSDFAARFDDDEVPVEVEQVLRTLEPIERMVRTDDQSRWFLMRIHPYHTPSNGIAGVVLSFVDVTQLKRAEAALREAIVERQRVERALQEADRRKDEFLAVLSHELRNPLAPIRNSLHILKHSGTGGEAFQRAQAIIERQVGHLARLVDDLLDVTRVARGKLELESERLDLRGLVQRTTEDHATLFAARTVRLDVFLPEGEVWIDGDPTRMAQVVGNLLQNAAKFTPSLGRVNVSLAVVDGRAELRFRDTGVGIEPTMLARLFQPFSQAEPTLARSQGGLGLGLALVKGLVDSHGGTVEVFSAGKDAGTEFLVRLPVVSPPVPVHRASHIALPVPRRVLIIDDNIDGAESLRDLLELDGHTVDVALDGMRGLEKVGVFRPDVILCDIGLPGVDGYQLAAALKANAALGGAFLVAMTGYALPEDKRRALDAGFDAHLPKPMTVDLLRKAISEASRAGNMGSLQ